MQDRYIKYRRVSKESQGKSGLGLESQDAIINQYYPETEASYCDVMSGATADRPQLQEAIKYCIENKATLVVAKADRLSRNVRDALEIFDLLEGRVRFCDIPGVPERFIITIHFAISERELELISIRIRAALAIKKGKGDPLGVKILVTKDGRELDPQRLVKSRGCDVAGTNRTQAAKVNLSNIRARGFATSLREQGFPFYKIAEILNEHSLLSPTGKNWQAGSVCRLIQQAR